jgi:hypothetical protein
MSTTKPRQLQIPEPVFLALLNFCRKNADSPESLRQRLEELGASNEFYQIIAILAFSCPERLEAKICTCRLRSSIFNLRLAAAGFSADPLPGAYGVADYSPEFQFRRLYPYGCWIEADGALVLFDRDYLPIARFRPGRAPEIVNPLEHINFVEQRWIYEDATAPHLAPDTQTDLVMLANICGISKEISFRCVLSNHGLIEPQVWATDWRRP